MPAKRPTIPLESPPAGGDEQAPVPITSAAVPATASLVDRWGRSHPVTQVCLLGRAAGATIRIDDDSISRQHAELERCVDALGQRAWLLRDLGSRNGTFVDCVRVLEPIVVCHHSELMLGNLRFCFREADGARHLSSSRPTVSRETDGSGTVRVGTADVWLPRLELAFFSSSSTAPTRSGFSPRRSAAT